VNIPESSLKVELSEEGLRQLEKWFWEVAKGGKRVGDCYPAALLQLLADHCAKVFLFLTVFIKVGELEAAQKALSVLATNMLGFGTVFGAIPHEVEAKIVELST